MDQREKLGRMNSDTILKPGQRQLQKNIYTAVMDFMNTLRKIKGHTKSYQYNKTGPRKTMLDLEIDQSSATKLILDLENMQNKWRQDELLSKTPKQQGTELTN